MRYIWRYFPALLFVPTVFLAQTNSSLWTQESSGERIFFDAKVFTGDTQNPYAEAVAIRGDKIIAVGNFPEVANLYQRMLNASHILGRVPHPKFRAARRDISSCEGECCGIFGSCGIHV